MIDLVINEWQYAWQFEKWTVQEALETIDDILCHGFELKVENGKIYWREF